MNECWHLVNDGILDVKDVDTVMSEGLGMRYAFLGPLETAHLNAEGMIVFFINYLYILFSKVIFFLVFLNNTFYYILTYPNLLSKNINKYLIYLINSKSS